MYPPDHCLTVCLCLEDADALLCDIFISQLATGQAFGVEQPFHLMLHGTDRNQLEDLRQEIHDCAFSLVKDISVHATFEETSCSPDIFLILLSNRSISYKNTPTETFQQLYSLVSYVTKMSELFASLTIKKILVVGDLALTAAAVMSSKLGMRVTSKQLLAVDGELRQQNISQHGPITTAPRQYSKINRIFDTLRQWWSGVKDDLASTYLGLKFIQTEQSFPFSRGTGYYFSAPVDLDGPKAFHTSSDLHIRADHVASVKATTDDAFRIVQEIEGQGSSNECYMMAHL